MDPSVNVEQNAPLIEGQPQKLKFYERQNIMVMILILCVGIFFLITGIIMLVPHKTLSDKKEVQTEEEMKTKDAYTYEHEYGGDRELRITTAYVLIGASVVCLILALLILFGMTDDLEFKNKNFMISIIVISVVVAGCFIYYMIYTSGSLNKKANENFKKVDNERETKAEGKAIIYIPCAQPHISELYETCIKPTKDRFEAKCAVDMISYNMIKPTDVENKTAEQIKVFDAMLKASTISEATYNFYKKLDTGKIPLNCTRVVNTQIENNPNDLRCKKKSITDFRNTPKHKDCDEKAEKQCKYDPTNRYNKDTAEGTTFSNTTERKKYMEAKENDVQIVIDKEMNDPDFTLYMDKTGRVPEFTESTSSSTRTEQSIGASS
jgi:hypothetical protein